MKLELANFPVKEVRFGKQTSYNNGVLEVNKEELVKLVSRDKRVASVDFDIPHPNEKTRIALVRDSVEPRVKVSGPGCVFPGIMGPVRGVGEGRTHRLGNMAVVTSAQYPASITSGMNARNASVLDNFGLGGGMSPLGKTVNLVLILKLADGVTELDAHQAIQLAEFRVANLLAETTRDKTPESVNIFELTKVDPSLPKIVYVASFTAQAPYPHTGVALYGMAIHESLPTFLHPNEFLDGAVTSDAREGSSIYSDTWQWMNLPAIFELYKNHGRTLNFLGVILQRTRFTSEHGKRVTAEVTSQMAKYLGADGSINTLLVCSGNNFMDVMFTVEALEKKGIKTVLVTPDWSANEGDKPLVFSVPEAVSIICSGPSIYRSLKVPRPDKVIGLKKGESMAFFPPETEDNMVSPGEELELAWPALITMGLDFFGFGNYTCKEY